MRTEFYIGKCNGDDYNIEVKEGESQTTVKISNNTEEDYCRHFNDYSKAMDTLNSTFDEIYPFTEKEMQKQHENFAFVKNSMSSNTNKSASVMRRELTGCKIMDFTKQRNYICIHDNGKLIDLLYYSKVLKEYTTTQKNKERFFVEHICELQKLDKTVFATMKLIRKILLE